MSKKRKLKSYKIVNFRANSVDLSQIEFLQDKFNESNRSSAIKKVLEICTVIMDFASKGHEIRIVSPAGESMKLDLK